jgi:demethylmenaquinone methyltransferase / 2-methoxy-6-polyprenyl-1,4-benzoquinol methylase
MERAEVDAHTRVRLGGEHARDRRAVLCEAARQRDRRLDVVHQHHAARIETVSGRTQHALSLFAPLGPTYERTAALLSFGQDPRWRRFLVSRVPPGSHVLDVATGTGAVAKELLARGCTVVGLDQSPEMLAEARRALDGRVELVEASAESLPFADASFDALTFTYLLRYVDEPGATVRELARVVRPGGTVASLEFGVPSGLARPAWEVWTRFGLPLAGRVLSPGWHEVGRFLNGSIREFQARLPLAAQVELWRAAGLEDVHVRRMSLGGGVVMWARRT